MKRFSFVFGFILGGILFGALTAFAAGSNMIEIFYNVKDIKINKVSKMPTEDKPFVYNGSTYVPLRFVADNLGYSVKWDGKTQTIWIGDHDAEQKIAYLGSDIKPMALNRGDLVFINQAKNIEDNVGNTHSTGYKVEFSTIGKSGELEFPLNGNYKKFVSKIGLTNKFLSFKGTITAKVFADGKEIYTKNFQAGEFPQDINLDVTGAAKLSIKFELETTSLESAEIGLYDPYVVD